jgi:hypothetical protein
MRDFLKPQVQYADIGDCRIGENAYVFLKQHPSLPLPVGGTWVHTSEVLGFIRHEANGPVFETRNSIYRPAETDESLPKATAQKASA